MFGWIECELDVCDNCVINVMLMEVGCVVFDVCLLCCKVFFD